MRAVELTIVTPPYGASKYQVKGIQTTLNKNSRGVLNADTFGDEAKQ